MQIKTKFANCIINTYKRLFKVFPVRNDIIYFTSYYGQYNDNPRYISEYIHKKNNRIKLVWEISEKSTQKDIPQYVKKVKRLSCSGLYFKNRAKVIVGNQIGENSRYIHSYENGSVITKFVKSFKKKNQIILSTWHGTALKKMGADSPSGKDIVDLASDLDILILGDKHNAKILGNLFYHKMPIKILGSPRNDILINGDHHLKDKIKMKLDLPLDKKIILFAPTYKSDSNNEDNIYRSGILHLEHIDFSALLKSLSDKFGGDWLFICRFHNHVSNKIDWTELSKKTNGCVLNGNKCDDMAEYLFISDVFMTDTTSSIFDYALTERPCFLFFPDFDHYNKVERGFYMNLMNLPFPLAINFKDLITNIDDFSNEIYKGQVRDLLKLIGNVDDGKASERIGDLIFSYLRDNNENFN